MHPESLPAALAAIVLPPAGGGAAEVVPSPSATRIQAGLEALAPNTRRAYGAALRIWGAWASVRGINSISPSPGDVREYLLERAEDGAKHKTLQLAVAALRKLQALAGVSPTASDQIVSDTLSGLGRDALPPRQASALTTGVLALISATACIPRTGRGGFLETPAYARKRGLVDIAICRLLSDGGLRRSEAAVLTWGDVEVWDDGSGRVTVQKSKTDSDPRTVYITPATVAALAAIRPLVAGAGDLIFGLADKALSRRVKAAAMAAGLGPGFSGHSGRVGMARRMASAGAPTHEIMAQGRWKSAGMVADYTRAETAGRAAKWLR